jgi:UDP-glucose 4-epimerase
MIVVTGANGFVGRYLVDGLVKGGFSVLATGHSSRGKEYYNKLNIPFVAVDITKEEDFDKLPKQGVNGVVHVAALLRIDRDIYTPMDYILVNGLGTFNVLEYCRKNNIEKMVYTMSHSDIDGSKSVIISEETPREYVSPYGEGNVLPFIVSKIMGADFTSVYHRDGIVQATTLRLSNIRGYGSRDTRHNCVFHQFIQKALKNDSIEIWGQHKTVRDLIYVKDVVSAIIKTLESASASSFYTIGSGKGLTIEDEAKAIIKAFSSPDNPSEIIYKPDTEEVRKKSTIFDISKAKRELSWEPHYSYEDAMADYKKEMERGYFA